MSTALSSVSENRGFFSNSIPLDVLNATVGTTLPTGLAPTLDLGKASQLNSGREAELLAKLAQSNQHSV